ncbi:MAG TPA: hypothetical protein VGZ52_08640, partial [Acidimicrobiales bacterium]|nr:hypothetical protein [Acidimicrobiales bacterium]
MSRRVKILIVVALAGACAAASAVSAGAGSAASLGRIVVLDLARRPTANGPGLAFAYTPAVRGDNTTTPQPSMHGEMLWSAALAGTSAVRPSMPGSPSNVTFGSSPAPTLGYAFPKDASGMKALLVSAAGTTVASNLAAGGATWEWTDSSGTQYLNHYDLGREL